MEPQPIDGDEQIVRDDAAVYAKRTMTNSSSDHDEEGVVDDDDHEDRETGTADEMYVKGNVAVQEMTAPTESTYVARLSAHHRHAPSRSTLHRGTSDRSISSNTSTERKRSLPGGIAKPSHAHNDDRTGFARIYFENQSFTSSTVLKLTTTTTVLELRKSMANKIKIPATDFVYYVIVVVYQSDSARSLSARTLQDDELVLPLVEKLNRVRTSAAEADDALGPLRPKPKHRSRPPLKFILKDVRGAPLDLENEHAKKDTSDTQGLSVPAFLGKGVRAGYLQKASVKDPNVWRKRWFVLKDDQLLYCKTATNQRDVTTISLLNAYLAKARPEVRVTFAFELRTPRRIYELCANSKEDMVAWIQALHVQIGIATENHRLYEAEIIITEDAVVRSEEETYASSPLSEPSLLQRVLSREDARKAFRDFACSIGSQPLIDTWIECENFRRNCIEREIGALASPIRVVKRTPKEEWDHLKAIIRATESLSMLCPEEIAQLRQSFQSEQINRRLSIALHSDAHAEFPRVELIASVHQKIFEAIECGPFKQFLMCRGYRALLERIMGRII